MYLYVCVSVSVSVTPSASVSLSVSVAASAMLPPTYDTFLNFPFFFCMQHKSCNSPAFGETPALAYASVAPQRRDKVPRVCLSHVRIHWTTTIMPSYFTWPMSSANRRWGIASSSDTPVITSNPAPRSTRHIYRTRPS